MEQLTKTFEDLVRRMFGPATALLISLFACHALEISMTHNRTTCSFFTALDLLLSQFSEQKGTVALGYSLLFLLGTGYIMATLLSAFFESRLRKAFHGGHQDEAFLHLRGLVLTKLKSHPRLGSFFYRNQTWLDDHDYYLYELLGAIDPMSTRSFVNSAKSYGIVCISIAIALSSLIFCSIDWLLAVFILIVLGALYAKALTLLKSKFRARAERLYFNFLLFPDEKIEALLRDCNLHIKELNQQLTGIPQPQLGKPYLCLLGTVGSNWRAEAHVLCENQGVPSKDTLDPAWDEINHENGDQRQAEIDRLVAQQQRRIEDAAAIYFQLEAKDSAGNPLAAYAARCELGYLTGVKKPTFAFIDPNVIGRNYLKAQCKPHLHIQVFDSGQAALEAACAYVRARLPS